MKFYLSAFFLTALTLSQPGNAAEASDIQDSHSEKLIKTESLVMRGSRELSANTVRQVRIIDDEKIIQTQQLIFSGQENR